MLLLHIASESINCFKDNLRKFSLSFWTDIQGWAGQRASSEFIPGVLCGKSSHVTLVPAQVLLTFAHFAH